MELNIIFSIITLHFVFDWFQPRIIQNAKWANTGVLALHVLISTMPFMLYACSFGADVPTLLWYCILLYGSHFLLDLISSFLAQLCKIAKSEYGLIIITAIDQMIHLYIYFYIFYKLSII
jgi:hypothetical protein|tara:strand:+ start:3065 stop:3424 length:360 start_codon:yes stop_codon:yes gene_type:complete